MCCLGCNPSNKPGKLDLFIGCFKDGDNKAFHACHAFIPNQRRWLFSLIFRKCVPKLWGQDIVQQNILAMTDGDIDMIISLQDAIKMVSGQTQ